MKTLVFFTLLLVFGAVEAGGIDPAVRAKVLGAKKQAIQVIQQYAEDSSNKDYQIAALMAQLLEKSKTIPAVGMSLHECNKNKGKLAGTDWITQAIALCPPVLSSKFSIEKLMQIFIHEAYHLYEGAYLIPQEYPDLYARMIAAPHMELDSIEKESSEKRAAPVECQIMMKVYGCVYIGDPNFPRRVPYCR